MSTRLHLPHPHIASRVAEAFEHAVNERLRHITPANTDPAAVARWADWQTPDQWMAAHGRTENDNA